MAIWSAAWSRGAPSGTTRNSMAAWARAICAARCTTHRASRAPRSEEHTSELQSQSNLVCRLLLEKKKKTNGPKLINNLQMLCILHQHGELNKNVMHPIRQSQGQNYNAALAEVAALANAAAH